MRPRGLRRWKSQLMNVSRCVAVRPIIYTLLNTKFILFFKRITLPAQLFRATDQLIRSFVYSGASDADGVAALFPADFHANLRQLCTRILLAHAAAWHESAAAHQVSAARLVDFGAFEAQLLCISHFPDVSHFLIRPPVITDWRVDIKTSSNLLSRMSVPTVLVGMKVQDVPTRVDLVPDVKDVQFELSKESLQTMLDGLNKIRDQLSAVK